MRWNFWPASRRQGRPLLVPPADSDRCVAPCATAAAHESLRGLWWLVELLPKGTRDLTNNYAARWVIPLGRRRQIFQISGLPARIHSSVEERLASGNDYKPPNLPLQYTVVRTRTAVTQP